MTYIFQFITIVFGLLITFYTAKIIDKSNLGFKVGTIIIIIEWLIFLNIYHSIWPKALN